VFALDVLLVINAINTHGIIELTGSNVPTTFLVDVNGDSMLTPLDVLTVINFVNASNRGASGEGESTPSVYQPPALDDGEEPPVGFAELYLGDEATNSPVPIIEEEAGLLGLVVSVPQAVPEVKSQRNRLLTFDGPAVIDSAFASLTLNT
jgi:hypothetical protein